MVAVLTSDEWEGTLPTVKARLTDVSGTALNQAAVSTITYHVYDLGAIEADAGTALVVATVIFNALQGWTVDSTGCNFVWLVPATKLPAGTANKSYRVEIVFVLATGEKIMLVCVFKRRNLISQTAA